MEIKFIERWKWMLLQIESCLPLQPIYLEFPEI